MLGTYIIYYKRLFYKLLNYKTTAIEVYSFQQKLGYNNAVEKQVTFCEVAWRRAFAVKICGRKPVL